MESGPPGALGLRRCNETARGHEDLDFVLWFFICFGPWAGTIKGGKQYLSLVPVPGTGTCTCHWYLYLSLVPVPVTGTCTCHWYLYLYLSLEIAYTCNCHLKLHIIFSAMCPTRGPADIYIYITHIFNVIYDSNDSIYDCDGI